MPNEPMVAVDLESVVILADAVPLAGVGEECRRRHVESVGLAYFSGRHWLIVRPCVPVVSPAQVLEREAQGAAGAGIVG
jgi:hypothetical protein